MRMLFEEVRMVGVDVVEEPILKRQRVRVCVVMLRFLYVCYMHTVCLLLGQDGSDLEGRYRKGDDGT
jgi:hypothetical protein